MDCVLWQVDKFEAALSPVEQVRRALVAVAARHGRRPTVVQVRAGAVEGPAGIDGARIVPTKLASYPGVMLLGWEA